jgi:putative RecB family exonuclease
VIAPLKLFQPEALVPPTPVENRLETLKAMVSASRLNTWLRCRLQFYFRYVERIRKAPSPALHTGGVMHAVLQAWNKARWRGEPLAPEALEGIFSTQWAFLQAGLALEWDGEEAQTQASAWRTLEAYFRETPIGGDEKPEGVEVPLEADLQAHGLPLLVGFLDLVRAGSRIVDFKTAAKTPDLASIAHHHELQMSCYALLYREGTGKKEKDLELHHLVKTKVPKILVTRLGPMTENQQSRLFRIMESYVQGVDRQDFVPSPGLACGTCDYLLECRVWTGRRHHV